MNPAMMNPEMMKAAQNMMSKMSPEDMQKMMEMQKKMMSNPAMMQQAQQMMSNPAMQQQAMNQMQNMSAEDLKSQVDMAANMNPGMMGGGAMPAAPAAPAKTAVERLKESAMAVADEVIEAVEEAENHKALGNKRFKASDWKGAAGKYVAGVESVEKALSIGGGLSGGDKKAVADLKEACHLNLANCRLKLGEWEGAIAECDKVLATGENRKARFRRGDALRELGRLEEARDDLAKANKMDPSDGVVAGKLKDVKAMIKEAKGDAQVEGVVEDDDDDDDDDDVEEVDTGGASSSSAPSSGGGSSNLMPNGMPMPDEATMERMLDQVTPEEMENRMSMLENLTPEQARAMGMPEGVDANQLKMMSSMMKGMDKDSLKSMAKMAAQMKPQADALRAAASGGGGGGGGGGAAAMPGMAGIMPGDLDNMDMSKGMDMMKNMNPDMMKAGMEMMKNMDPEMMKSMGKMMGREIDPAQMEQMQAMMKDMSPEDMEKWANRAQKVAGFAQKPVQAYQACKAWAAKLGAVGALGVLGGLLGIMWIGHLTDSF